MANIERSEGTAVITEEADRHFTVGISGDDYGYDIRHVQTREQAEQLARDLPPATDVLDGCIFDACRRYDQPDRGIHSRTWVFMRADDQANSWYEKDRLYTLEGLRDEETLDTIPMPDIRIVAREETEDNWAPEVVAVLGRIKGVYAVNISDDTYYDRPLIFMANECERRFTDAEEGEVDAICARAGFATYTDFQQEFGDTYQTSAAPYEIEQMETLDRMKLPFEWTAEFMLETREHVRDGMLNSAVSEAMANGIDAGGFEGGCRSDDEIEEAGRALLGLEESLSRP